MTAASDTVIRKLSIGAEKAPLLVVENFADNPQDLVEAAATRQFGHVSSYFPGIRAKAPLSYRRAIVERLQDLLLEFFELEGRGIRFPMCHYSLVTTPPEDLVMLQRIPHFDSLESRGLATIHYLFRGSYGGTAFYRHRKTGFEYIDESRKDAYFRALEQENNGPNMPGPAYINGDTPLFEQVACQDGVFNRLLVYRRNSLHSGCIERDFVPDPDPRSGRLSINSFIDAVP